MRSKTKDKKATSTQQSSTTGGGPQIKVEFKGIDEQIHELITNTEAFGYEIIEESTTNFVSVHMLYILLMHQKYGENIYNSFAFFQVFSNGTLPQSSINSLLYDDRIEDENKNRIGDGNEDQNQNVQNKEPNGDEESMEEEGNGKSIIKPVKLPKKGTKQNGKEEKSSSSFCFLFFSDEYL